MTVEDDYSSRREFLVNAGKVASAVALSTSITPAVAGAARPAELTASQQIGEWDMSWLNRLAIATDRAVFDWPSLGDPADPIVLEIAARYLDNCETAYSPRKYVAQVVLNIRTQAVPAALSDAVWQKYALGAEYKVTDPVTKQIAVHNPFLYRAPEPIPGATLPSLTDLLQRGAVILVCDFALGHLAKRLADKAGGKEADVHAELRNGFVPGAFAVPSGIFGLAKAQNAGCAFVRM